MGVIETQRAPADITIGERPPIINDFSINVATANGTGSQTSNMAILRALVQNGHSG